MVDFNVNITASTTPVSRAGFGLILILDSSKDHPYTLYNSVSDVAEDYSASDRAYKLAEKIFMQNPAPSQVAIVGKEYTSADPSELIDFMNEVADENNDWFGFVTTENEKPEVVAFSNWIESLEKVYAVTHSDFTIDPEIENEQTLSFYHDKDDDFTAEGLLTYMLVRTIGGVTGKFKTISGSVGVNITATQLNELHANNGNTYIRKMGVLQTTDGKSSNGEYFDVVLSKFFIKFRMQEELAKVALNTEKTPYTNVGISLLVGAVSTILELASENDIIAIEDGEPQYTIVFRKKEDVPIAEVANRVYNYIEWEATLAGAIHEGTINGVLTL